MTAITPARILASTVARDQEVFARDAGYAAELLKLIADTPDAAHVVGDLTRLSQQVSELIRRAATIKASSEALGMMETVTSVTEK
ncbi:hypothetical protein [Streptomyces sp. NPDC007991]|uniref:hypothetical protein n=1 Tax=Streptomyces sp. NPDC007991 TaxID=3364803 RepID=UPI0036E30FCA